MVRQPEAMVSRTLHRARELLRAGQVEEAARLYRATVATQPAQVDALRALSYIALQSGQMSDAREFARRAVEAQPDDARLWLGLGRACKADGAEAQAIAAYERALALQPDLLDGWISLGVACRARDPQRALQCYERARALDPRHAGALINSSNVLMDLGRHDEAERLLRQRIEHAAGVQVQLGKLLMTQGRATEAEELFRAALEDLEFGTEAALHLGVLLRLAGRHRDAAQVLRDLVLRHPGHAGAHHALGEILADLGEYTQALAACQRSVSLNPNVKEVHYRMAVILRMGGAVSAARDAALRTLAIDPGFVAARCSLADIEAAFGDAEAADLLYRDQLESPELRPAALSNYLIISNRLPDLSAEQLAERHRRYTGRYASLATAGWTLQPDPARRLRVAYMSGDLRRHSVAYFIEPVLANHDRERFDIWAYSTNPDTDDLTVRLRGCCDNWVECAGLPDESVAQRIRDDRIDILVDLSGHTGWNRLQVFARKPAPVQVTWLGYPTTTGLSAMDYRISDWEVDPAGSEAFSAERLIRLSSSYYCYRPFAGAPPVESLPALACGHFTFGSFNDLAKFGGASLDLWAAVLNAVPGSRLLLKASGLADSGARARLTDAFVRRGIGAERLEMYGWAIEMSDHLALYNRIDLALDTHPYNGATTTCEALWMGVPVITLQGATHASRMGASLLKAAGLEQFATESREDYVRLAVDWAGRPEQLDALRRSMRERMRGSPLLGEAGFTHELEAAYRNMWERWCEASR